MSEPRALRPRTEVFERPSWRLTIVDPDRILAEAAEGPVELLSGAVFPRHVRLARLTVAPSRTQPSRTQSGGTLPSSTLPSPTQPSGTVLTGHLRIATAAPARQLTLVALGNDPLSVRLARRVAAGDEWAIRVAGGLRTAVDAVSRRLGIAADVESTPSEERGAELASRLVADAVTGLTTTVTEHAAPEPGGERGGTDRIVALRAVVPPGELTAGHLAALFEVALSIVDESTRDELEPVAPRTYTIGSREEQDRVTLDQVGGLDDVVTQFREVAISFRHPQAMARWGARRPQGILLYGPPGTGKTMLARALATEIHGTLREIRTPEILDKWLGASERNIKRIFAEARRYTTPTVLLFDEFDSIISYAGAGGDSGSQAVNAVAGIFKQEMNSLIDENPNVIVVATTNFPQRVDASLVRSGRFDVKIAIPLPDEGSRAQILTRMIGGLIAEHEVAGFRMFGDDIDVAELARRSPGKAGADLREVLRRAQMDKAMQEARTGVPASPISQSDLLAGIVALG